MNVIISRRINYLSSNSGMTKKFPMRRPGFMVNTMLDKLFHSIPMWNLQYKLDFPTISSYTSAKGITGDLNLSYKIDIMPMLNQYTTTTGASGDLNLSYKIDIKAMPIDTFSTTGSSYDWEIPYKLDFPIIPNSYIGFISEIINGSVTESLIDNTVGTTSYIDSTVYLNSYTYINSNLSPESLIDNTVGTTSYIDSSLYLNTFTYINSNLSPVELIDNTVGTTAYIDSTVYLNSYTYINSNLSPVELIDNTVGTTAYIDSSLYLNTFTYINGSAIEKPISIEITPEYVEATYLEWLRKHLLGIVHYFISPTGDNTNIGSYDLPLLDFTNIPSGSTVVLKNGTYNNTFSDASGGVVPSIGINTNAAFKGMNNKNDLTIIGESQTGVILMRNKGTQRDNAIMPIGNNNRLINVTINSNLGSTGLYNYQVALNIKSLNTNMDNVIFNFNGGTYSLTYNGGPAYYNNCKFNNGTIMDNYSGQSFVVATSIYSNTYLPRFV